MPVRRSRVVAGLTAGAAVVGLVLTMGPRWAFGPSISAVVVRRSPLVQTVAATGRVRPQSRLEIAAVQLGAIKAADCREGARVEGGAVLFELRDESQRAALADAIAQQTQAEVRLEDLQGPGRRNDLEALRRADIGLADAQDRLARLERLGSGQGVAESQIAEARRARDLAASQLETARANALGSDTRGGRRRLQWAEVERARANVAAARARLEETRIIAPRSGVLVSCDAVPGEVVTAGRSMAVLVSDGPLEIVIEPDEKNLKRLASGQLAHVVADAFPDQPFEARISMVVQAVDPIRGTIEVRLAASAPPAFLVPDMTVSVEVEAAKKSDALVVPREAIQRSGGSPWLYTHRNGRAERTEVVLGLEGQDAVEIERGIDAGDVVLLPGPYPLTPGARARTRLGGS